MQVCQGFDLVSDPWRTFKLLNEKKIMVKWPVGRHITSGNEILWYDESKTKLCGHSHSYSEARCFSAKRCGDVFHKGKDKCDEFKQI